MKAGDIVTITDGSWSKKVVNGGLVDEYGISLKKQQWTVVETDCSFPLEQGYCVQPRDYRNDTVVQGVETGDVVFICSGFLKLVEPAHVWEHGDVFKNSVGVQIYLEPSPKPIVVNLGYTNSRGTPEIQLDNSTGDVTFLFNIKDRL